MRSLRIYKGVYIMIEIKGIKVTLKEPSIAELEKLYYWRFEEKEQEAKKMY